MLINQHATPSSPSSHAAHAGGDRRRRRRTARRSVSHHTTRAAAHTHTRAVACDAAHAFDRTARARARRPTPDAVAQLPSTAPATPIRAVRVARRQQQRLLHLHQPGVPCRGQKLFRRHCGLPCSTHTDPPPPRGCTGAPATPSSAEGQILRGQSAAPIRARDRAVERRRAHGRVLDRRHTGVRPRAAYESRPRRLFASPSHRATPLPRLLPLPLLRLTADSWTQSRVWTIDLRRTRGPAAEAISERWT